MTPQIQVRLMLVIMWTIAIAYVLFLVYLLMGGCRERIQHIHEYRKTYARVLGADESYRSASFVSLQVPLSSR